MAERLGVTEHTDLDWLAPRLTPTRGSPTPLVHRPAHHQPRDQLDALQVPNY
jgi:hypothetical protein